MHIIGVTIRKGGVGKSTISAGIGQMLANQGKRVALIDLDTQSNLAMILGAMPGKEGAANWLEGLPPSFTEIALDGGKPFDLLDGLPRIPSIRDNDLLNQVSRLPHDYVVFDCAPSEGPLSVVSTRIAHTVVIPMECDALSATGAQAVHMLLRPEQRTLHVLNKFQPTRSQDGYFLSHLRGPQYGGIPVKTIRADEKLRNSCSKGMGFTRSGRASEDLKEVVQWITEATA